LAGPEHFDGQVLIDATNPLDYAPAAGGWSPTVEIDDVDVHESLAVNGGFEHGAGPWIAYPNTNSTYHAYRTALVQGATPPAPRPPVVTTPVPVRLPRPKARHALKVEISLSWTWRYGVTRLDKVKIGSLPRHTHIKLRCLGRGCPRHSNVQAAGARRVRRLLKRLQGRRYRAGDILRITLTAPGYRPERAEVVIRYGNLPRARLLSP
jgi:hypothetical protein